MFEGLLLPWQKSTILLFFSIFRTTPEGSSKLYLVEICYLSEKLWPFNHKRADFWFKNLGFKRSLLSLLNRSMLTLTFCIWASELSVDVGVRRAFMSSALLKTNYDLYDYMTILVGHDDYGYPAL